MSSRCQKSIGDVRIYHTLYSTTLQGVNGGAICGEIRVSSPAQDSPLRDVTVAVMVTKTCVPAQDTMLEALYPIPGGPTAYPACLRAFVRFTNCPTANFR
jgi:hypothetical protein